MYVRIYLKKAGKEDLVRVKPKIRYSAVLYSYCHLEGRSQSDQHPELWKNYFSNPGRPSQGFSSPPSEFFFYYTKAPHNNPSAI